MMPRDLRLQLHPRHVVDLKVADKVGDGEAWFVRLRHREMFAIADPVERVTRATLELSQPTLTSSFADALTRARSVDSPRALAPAAAPTVASAPLAPSPVTPAAPTIVAEPLALTLPSAPVMPAAPAAPIDLARIVRPNERVALFVDGANTDGACRAAGYFVDFRKAREYFLAGGIYYGSFYYVADFSDSDPRQMRFFDFLSHAGYIVGRRPAKIIRDQDTGERIIQGQPRYRDRARHVQHAQQLRRRVPLSGDSDFERAVDLLRSRGKRLYIVTARTQLSRELAYVADKPIFYLEDHRERLAREDRGPAI